MDISNNNTKRRILYFTILAIVIGWLIALSIPALGLYYGDKTSAIILAIMMFSPMISSVLTRVITKEGFKKMYLKPNFKGNIKNYIIVFFGISILLLLSGILYFIIFPNILDTNLTQINLMLKMSGIEGLTAKKYIVISVLQIIFIGPIVNIVPTLGEEIGWRGYLLPKLREIYSDRIALVITGIIWGMWHLPVIVMGHNYGTDYIGYPYLGILAMIFFCVVLGIIMGYATIKIDSVIPAAMIHSTINAGAMLPILLIDKPSNTLLGPAITGLIGGIPFIILAIILFVKSDN